MGNIREDIRIINERLKKIYILYRRFSGSQGETNKIESIKLNGAELPISNKSVNVSTPTKTSELNNDSGFITSNKIEDIRVNGELVPIINKEVIMNVPTKTTNLINDSNFVTKPYVDTHIVNKANPHNVTKSQIGLGNVDNTSDINKPISTATQTELNKKLDKPTTNNTNQFVILGDGSTAPKSDFGKVDKVMGVEPDANKNVDISGVATNWTNASQRWSALPNKSTDATYNKVMVLDSNGKAGMKNLDFVPYTGANKSIDLNTQRLTHEGELVKRENHFERKLLRNGNSISSNYVKLTDVCSLSLPYDASITGDIVITLPIKTSTKWTIEVDIDQSDVLSSKLIITSYGIKNLNPKVSILFGHDKIHSVKFCRKDDSSAIIIKRAEQESTFSYGRVNLSALYYSIAYSSALEIKSNYKIEFLKEEDIEGLTINSTILNKDFDRDPYLLDFRNFTNVPNFAKASNVFAKGEATNWTSANQRWSNLPNKSADATYNKVMVLDSNGKAGVKEVNNTTFFDKNGVVERKMAIFIDVFETNEGGVFTADFSMVGFIEPPKVIVSTETEEPANVTKAENGTYVSIFKDSITTTACTGRVKLATSGGLLVGMVSSDAGAGVKVTVEAIGLI